MYRTDITIFITSNVKDAVHLRMNANPCLMRMLHGTEECNKTENAKQRFQGDTDNKKLAGDL